MVKVVDEMSAILHLPNETAIPLEADHQGMCKFLTSSNPNYIVVRDCIDEIIETLARVSGSSCTSWLNYFLSYFFVRNRIGRISELQYNITLHNTVS